MDTVGTVGWGLPLIYAMGMEATQQHFCTLSCLLTDAVNLFWSWCWTRQKAPGRRRERCCGIKSAAHGCSEGFDTWSDAVPPSTNIGPIRHAVSRVARAFMRSLFLFACLSRACVCSVSPLWKNVLSLLPHLVLKEIWLKWMSLVLIGCSQMHSSHTQHLPTR